MITAEDDDDVDDVDDVDDEHEVVAPLLRTKREKREKVVARRVRRVVRRLDPWSVLKVSLVFYVCGYIVTMVAGVLLWNVAERADMITKLEDFVEELGAYERFELLPDVILEQALLIGAILAVLATGLTVLAAVLFNLISDLVGGIRVVVLEEETARTAAPRLAAARPPEPRKPAPLPLEPRPVAARPPEPRPAAAARPPDPRTGAHQSAAGSGPVEASRPGPSVRDASR